MDDKPLWLHIGADNQLPLFTMDDEPLLLHIGEDAQLPHVIDRSMDQENITFRSLMENGNTFSDESDDSDYVFIDDVDNDDNENFQKNNKDEQLLNTKQLYDQLRVTKTNNKKKMSRSQRRSLNTKAKRIINEQNGKQQPIVISLIIHEPPDNLSTEKLVGELEKRVVIWKMHEKQEFVYNITCSK